MLTQTPREESVGNSAGETLRFGVRSRTTTLSCEMADPVTKSARLNSTFRRVISVDHFHPPAAMRPTGLVRGAIH